MDINVENYLVPTLICLTPIVLYFVVLAIRLKDIQIGIRLSLLFSIIALPVIFIFVSFFNFFKFLPEPFIQNLNNYVVFSSLICLSILGLIHWHNVKDSGKLYKTPIYYQDTQISFIWAVLYFFPVLLGFLSNSGEEFPEFSFIYMLLSFLLFTKLFFSFQLRERGIINQGQVILFNDIVSMQWIKKYYKEKIAITTRFGKKIEVTIPAEFRTHIDTHIEKYATHQEN